MATQEPAPGPLAALAPAAWPWPLSPRTREAKPGRWAPAPETVRLPDGSQATVAGLKKAQVRATDCTYVGHEKWGATFSHVKIELKSLHLREQHLDEGTSHCAVSSTLLTSQARDQISALTLEVGGQTLDYLASSFNTQAWSASDKLQVIVANKRVSLPAQAKLSLRYTSPKGGVFCLDQEPIYIAKQPVDIDPEGSRLCSVM